MKRIYHPYWLWEDYKAGFYDNVSGERKKELILKVVEMFNNKDFSLAWESENFDSEHFDNGNEI